MREMTPQPCVDAAEQVPHSAEGRLQVELTAYAGSLGTGY